jgi:hypothetical protein
MDALGLFHALTVDLGLAIFVEILVPLLALFGLRGLPLPAGRIVLLAGRRLLRLLALFELFESSLLDFICLGELTHYPILFGPASAALHRWLLKGQPDSGTSGSADARRAAARTPRPIFLRWTVRSLGVRLAAFVVKLLFVVTALLLLLLVEAGLAALVVILLFAALLLLLLVEAGLPPSSSNCSLPPCCCCCLSNPGLPPSSQIAPCALVLVEFAHDSIPPRCATATAPPPDAKPREGRCSGRRTAQIRPASGLEGSA